MSPDPTSIKPIVLRNRALHGLCWAAVLLFLVLLVVFMVTGPAPDPEPADYVGQAVLNGGAVAIFLRATRLRVVLTNEGLTAYNLLTTHHLTWDDVVDASADYAGLHIRRANGETVTAGSLGTPRLNLFGMGKGETWAGEVRARAKGAH